MAFGHRGTNRRGCSYLLGACCETIVEQIVLHTHQGFVAVTATPPLVCVRKLKAPSPRANDTEGVNHRLVPDESLESQPSDSPPL